MGSGSCCRRPKADQEGEGSIVHVAANPLAAIAALRAWLDEAGIRAGFAFRRITRTGAVRCHPLSAGSLRLILKERALASRLSGRGAGPHHSAQPARRLHYRPGPSERARTRLHAAPPPRLTD